MELNALTLWSMILVNTAVCIALPKIITFNWSKLLTR